MTRRVQLAAPALQLLAVLAWWRVFLSPLSGSSSPFVDVGVDELLVTLVDVGYDELLDPLVDVVPGDLLDPIADVVSDEFCPFVDPPHQFI